MNIAKESNKKLNNNQSIFLSELFIKLEKGIEDDESEYDDKLCDEEENIHAYWKLHTYMPHTKYCSMCGKDSPKDKMWDVCPNCKAKMMNE